MYSAELYAICCRYASDNNEAKDILQEGFIKIFTHLNQYNATGPLYAWMKKIIVNTALNFIKKNKKHFAKDVDDYKNAVSDQEKTFQDLDMKDLMKSFMELPYKYRVVLGLFIVEGYSYQEISKLINVEETTCRTRVFRGKIMLQKKLIALNKFEAIIK